jgi:hypothetical protein
MGMVGILMKQRDMIMDRYIALMKKFDLTEAEMHAKKQMQNQLIDLDFRIEQAKEEEDGL